MDSAIILCGGKATRMGELCKKTPKILMKIGNNSILDYQIELLKLAGVHRIILAVGHLMHTIKDEIGSSYHGMDIIYSEETEPLGTAGAFKKAFKYLKNGESCFGLNGDIFMPDFEPQTFEHSARLNLNADICITTFSWVPPYGIIERLDGNNFGTISKFIEKKPVMVNAGFYIITPQAMKSFPDKGSIEHDVFEKSKKCGYYLYNGVWFDCGTPQHLAQVNDYLKTRLSTN